MRLVVKKAGEARGRRLGNGTRRKTEVTLPFVNRESPQPSWRSKKENVSDREMNLFEGWKFQHRALREYLGVDWEKAK